MNNSEDGVMTVQEVSRCLRLAESTVYKLAQSGEIPGRKIGGRWRFSRQRLCRWLEKNNEQPPNDKIPSLVVEQNVEDIS